MIEAEQFPFGLLRGKAGSGDAKEVGEILSPEVRYSSPSAYTCRFDTVLASASEQVACKNSDARGKSRPGTFVGGALPNHWKS